MLELYEKRDNASKALIKELERLLKDWSEKTREIATTRREFVLPTLMDDGYLVLTLGRSGLSHRRSARADEVVDLWALSDDTLRWLPRDILSAATETEHAIKEDIRLFGDAMTSLKELRDYLGVGKEKC